MVEAFLDWRGRDAYHNASPQSTKQRAVLGAIRPGGGSCGVILSATSIWSKERSIDRPCSTRVTTPVSRPQAAPTEATLGCPPATRMSARPSTTNPTAVLAAMGLKDGPTRVKPGIWKNQPINASRPRISEVLPAEISRARRPKVAAFWFIRSEEHTSELPSPCNLVCRL